jgi:hypothetical protein
VRAGPAGPGFVARRQLGTHVLEFTKGWLPNPWGYRRANTGRDDDRVRLRLESRASIRRRVHRIDGTCVAPATAPPAGTLSEVGILMPARWSASVGPGR